MASEVELTTAQALVRDLPLATSGTVVGAPGTGKTATLVERVAALVASGVSPDDLLVLTPTRQTATDLRDRLALRVRRATRGPLARSVAAFAFDVVRATTALAGEPNPRLLTGGDEDRIIHDLLDGDAEDEAAGLPSRWPEGFRPEVRETSGFRAEVRSFLAEMQTLGIDPTTLAARSRREDLPIWASLASFAEEYLGVRDEMRRAHRDAAGLVREAVGLLRSLPPEAAELAAVRYRAVLVDDAQELTLGGIELVEALRARGVAVLAFGDPDVGSGSFRGARPENFARLAGSQPPFVLDDAHRFTDAQRDLVATLTSRIGAVGVVSHRLAPRGAGPDASVRAHVLRSAAEEYDTIAYLLRTRVLRGGVPWGRCAVIAHDTRQVAALARELAARDVPTAELSPTRALGEAPLVRALVTLAEAALRDPHEWAPEDAAAVLQAAGMDAVEVRRLRAALRQTDMTDPDAVARSGTELLTSGFVHPVEFSFVDTREGRRAARVAETVARLRTEVETGATAHELLWVAWEGSGLAREVTEAARGTGSVAESARRDTDDVVALFQAAKRHGERDDGTTPASFIRGLRDSTVAEDRLSAPVPEGAVRLMTPAGALGTEYDTVVVAGVQDGVWPNVRVRGSLLHTWRLASPEAPAAADRRREVLYDELRLFVRALSRARSRIVVTAVSDDDTVPSPLLEFLPDPLPAPVEASHPLTLRGAVARYRRDLTTPGTTEATRAEAAAQLAVLAGAGVPGAAPEEWYGVREVTSGGGVRDERQPVRISPSRVDALETCALDWVIADLGGSSQSHAAGVGTLVHAAFELGVVGADADALWAVVDGRWGELEFESEWRANAERKRARGLVDALARYLADTAADGTRSLNAEARFEVTLSEADVPGGAVLSGTVDSVEATSDGRVMIVDLKTGKNEPRTDKGVVNNPQLAAYQLAYERGGIAADAGRAFDGAKLVLLTPNAVRSAYAQPRQQPFTEETRSAFVHRLGKVARAMRGTRFEAPFEDHCRDDFTRALCRIHTIGPVSSA